MELIVPSLQTYLRISASQRFHRADCYFAFYFSPLNHSKLPKYKSFGEEVSIGWFDRFDIKVLEGLI